MTICQFSIGRPHASPTFRNHVTLEVGTADGRGLESSATSKDTVFSQADGLRASDPFYRFSIMRFRDCLLFRRLLVLCTWLVAVASGYAESTNHAARVAQRPEQKIGRPVRVVSLSFHDKSVAEIAQVVDREGAKGVDLIILPETWCGQEESPEVPGRSDCHHHGCAGEKARHVLGLSH